MCRVLLGACIRSRFAGSHWCCSTEGRADLHSHPHLVLSDFLIFPSLMDVKWQLNTVWTYLSLMTNEIRHLPYIYQPQFPSVKCPAGDFCSSGSLPGLGSLAFCSPWGRKELDMTEPLNQTGLTQLYPYHLLFSQHETPPCFTAQRQFFPGSPP